jgi:hypothetical protein
VCAVQASLACASSDGTVQLISVTQSTAETVHASDEREQEGELHVNAPELGDLLCDADGRDITVLFWINLREGSVRRTFFLFPFEALSACSPSQSGISQDSFSCGLKEVDKHSGTDDELSG